MADEEYLFIRRWFQGKLRHAAFDMLVLQHPSAAGGSLPNPPGPPKAGGAARHWVACHFSWGATEVGVGLVNCGWLDSPSFVLDGACFLFQWAIVGRWIGGW